MTKKRVRRSKPPTTLRERAEAATRASRADIAGMSAEEIQRMVHELQVHQIELEMQNEELRRAQAELGESRDRFNDLYDFAPVGYVTLDRDGTVLQANLTAAALLGIERGKLVGRKFTRFVARSAQDTLYLHQRAVLDDGKRQACDLQMRRADGATFFARMETTCAHEASSRGVHFLSAISDITERRRAEDALALSRAELEHSVIERTAALQASERMAQAVVDGLTALIAIVDERGCIVAVNERWRNFAHKNNGTLISVSEGANYLKVCAAAAQTGSPEAAVVAQGIRDVLAGTRQEFAAEYPCHSPTEQRWFILHVTPFPTGGPPRAVVAHENVTVRMLAELELRASEERYRQLIHALPVALYTCDVKGRILLYNAAAVKLWGREPNIGRDRWGGAHRLYTPDGRRLPRTRRPMAVAVTQDDPIRDAELIIERPDGGRSHVLAFPDPIHDSAGTVIGAVNVLVDITELQRATAALHVGEERLRAILNTVVDAIITINPRGTITGVNPATERIFGYGSGEMIGQNVSILMPAPYRAEHDGYLANYHRTGQARIIGIGREVQAQRKDGSVFPIDLAVSEVKDMQLFTGVIRDITERKRLEAEVLEIGEEERLRVAADLHDGICQEMAGLQFFANVLRQKLARADHPLVAHASRLEKGIVGTMDHIRQVARGMNPVVSDGGGLQHALRLLAATTASRHRIRCPFACADSIAIENPRVANELYRIAQEAIHNAVRHGHAKRITVRLDGTAAEISLSVQDNGRGLPADAPDGAGMGLRLMKYRAGLIGGSLTVQSRKRHGTEVICRIERTSATP